MQKVMQLLCGLETALLFSSVDKLEVMGSHLATHYGIPRTFWTWVFSCLPGAPSLWGQGCVEETTAGISFPDHQQRSSPSGSTAFSDEGRLEKALDSQRLSPSEAAAQGKRAKQALSCHPLESTMARCTLASSSRGKALGHQNLRGWGECPAQGNLPRLVGLFGWAELI